jgi:DnaD/phage-associated family protein
VGADDRDEKFKGFPRGVHFTPVPNPLLAGLLEEIDDLAELKVTLRVIWAINQKRGGLHSVTLAELCSDRTVAAMLEATGGQLETAVTRALERAVLRGTLLEGNGQYFLNTAPNRSAVERGAIGRGHGATPETRQSLGEGAGTETVFALYEENIGPLTPLIGERLAAAVSEYGETPLREAVRIAVESNARSWSYVAAVLKRMADEGRAGGTNGEPGRDSAQDRDAAIQRYLERQRRRGG